MCLNTLQNPRVEAATNTTDVVSSRTWSRYTFYARPISRCTTGVSYLMKHTIPTVPFPFVPLMYVVMTVVKISQTVCKLYVLAKAVPTY